MPPRPRPRPRARVALSLPSDGVSGSEAAGPTSAAPSEDDAFVIRRFSTWEDLDRRTKRAKEAELKAEKEENGGEISDTESPIMSPGTPRRTNKTVYTKIKPLPDWAQSLKNQKKHTVDVIELDDSDSEVIETYGDRGGGLDSTPRAGPSRKRIKRARSRSRSRSITPPPPVSQEQLLYATEIYRQSHPQSSFNASDGSNTIDLASDDEDDGLELDPELLKIKQAIRQQSVRAESVDRTKDTDSEDEDEDPANQVMLVVTWVHNPENDSPSEDKKEMKFPYPRHKPFQKFFDIFADIMDIPSSRLVILYNNRRVYPGSTPDVLKMWEKAKLTACEQATLKHLEQSQSLQVRGSSLGPVADGSSEHSYARAQSVASDVDDNVEKMKVIIKSSSVEHGFRVKVNTTCEELITKFLTKAGLPTSIMRGAKKPFLLLDGDKLSYTTTVADMDIEDGDQVEISNL